MYFRFIILDFYFKADGRVRTGDLRFTKPLLYQLSYIGNLSKLKLYFFNGQARICTLEGVSQQIYSLPRLTTSVPALTWACELSAAPRPTGRVALRTRHVFPQTSF